MSKKRQPWDSVWGPKALLLRRKAIREQQAALATRRDEWIERNHYYYDQVLNLLRFIIEPDKKILGVRCESGKYLSGLNARHGLGIEITEEIVQRARLLNPNLRFERLDAEVEELDGTFDYILVENVQDMTDPLIALKNLKCNCEPHTRIVICSYNHLWKPIFDLAESFGIKMPRLEPNWLSENDLSGLLHLAGYEKLKTLNSVLLPKKIPIISWFANRFLAPLPFFNLFCLVRVIIARPVLLRDICKPATVSVIIPCKDEEGNIEAAVTRTAVMGAGTELIFCDDKSVDKTAEEVRRMQSVYPDREIHLIAGPGINKAKNVWTGFDSAKGDILMILDADLTVMPEELPYFYEALVNDKAEFVNGVRLVFPMQQRAMKYTNLVGNKIFSLLFSFVLGTEIKDTLCGTKVFWRSDWPRIKKLIGTWGIEDHWGDYDLIFGAGKLNLKLVDLPVHYQERNFGKTKMSGVVKNGLRMLGIIFHAYKIFLVRR